MGINIRPVSARISNGSRMIVNGQPTTGVKAFPVTFLKKTNPYQFKSSDFINKTVSGSTEN
jgi:hypothetical protein